MVTLIKIAVTNELLQYMHMGQRCAPKDRLHGGPWDAVHPQLATQACHTRKIPVQIGLRIVEYPSWRVHRDALGVFVGALGTKRNLTTLRAQRKLTRRVSTPNPLGLRHARHGGWPAARCGRCLAARSRVRDVLIGHPRGHMQRRERGGAPLEVLHWHPPHGEGGCFAWCALAEFLMDFAPDCSYMCG